MEKEEMKRALTEAVRVMGKDGFLKSIEGFVKANPELEKDAWALAFMGGHVDSILAEEREGSKRRDASTGETLKFLTVALTHEMNEEEYSEVAEVIRRTKGVRAVMGVRPDFEDKYIRVHNVHFV